MEPMDTDQGAPVGNLGQPFNKRRSVINIYVYILLLFYLVLSAMS